MSFFNERIHSLVKLPSPVRVVDIGASPLDGPPPYTPLLAEGRASVIGFEPHAPALAILNERKGPHEVYLPHAVGDGTRRTLHHCKSSGFTSLLKPDPQLLPLFYGFTEWGEVVQEVEIDTVRLDDVPEAEGMDFLKIDIQGAELLVLENAVKRLKTAVLLHVEVEFLPIYKNQPLFSDVDLFLRRHGYTLHRFSPLISRALKPFVVDGDINKGLSQAVWADAVFIKSFLNLPEFSTEQLLKLAVILHECYHSHDVVGYLLNEHDRRAGTSYLQKYVGKSPKVPLKHAKR